MLLDSAIELLGEPIGRDSEFASSSSTAANVGARAAKDSLLPLRIFVVDVDEFPALTEQFQIEAFPTTIVFGGRAPLVTRVFLTDDSFKQMLRASFSSEVLRSPTPQHKRGLFR